MFPKRHYHSKFCLDKSSQLYTKSFDRTTNTLTLLHFQEPLRHHQEKTRIIVDNRGVTRSGGASNSGIWRTDFGQDKQSQKTVETGPHKTRYRTKDWKEKEVDSEAKEWKDKAETAEAVEEDNQRADGWQIGTSSVSQVGRQRVSSSKEERGKMEEVDDGSSTTAKPQPMMTTWSSHRKAHTEG